MLGLAGRFEDAKARADKALSVDPKNVDALVLRANTLAGLTDLDAALEQIQEVLKIDPRADVQTNLGAVQAMRGNLPEAEAAFRQAVFTDPKSVDALVALGTIPVASGKSADAEVAFKKAVALAPTNELANGWLGTFYMASGRTAEAEPYFRNLAANSKLKLRASLWRSITWSRKDQATRSPLLIS